MQNLTSISFARLLNVSKIWIVKTLINARSIELHNNYSRSTFFVPGLRINADVERNVNFERLKSENFTMNTATSSLYNNFSPLNISFPSLQDLDGFVIGRNITT